MAKSSNGWSPLWLHHKIDPEKQYCPSARPYADGTCGTRWKWPGLGQELLSHDWLDSDLGLWRTSVTGSMRTGLNSARPLRPSSPPRCKAPTQPLIKVWGNSCLDSSLSVRPKFRRRRRRQRDLRTLHELLAEDLLVGFLSVHSFNALVLWKKGDLFLCVCALCTVHCTVWVGSTNFDCE